MANRPARTGAQTHRRSDVARGGLQKLVWCKNHAIVRLSTLHRPKTGECSSDLWISIPRRLSLPGRLRDRRRVSCIGNGRNDTPAGLACMLTTAKTDGATHWVRCRNPSPRCRHLFAIPLFESCSLIVSSHRAILSYLSCLATAEKTGDRNRSRLAKTDRRIRDIRARYIIPTS